MQNDNEPLHYCGEPQWQDYLEMYFTLALDCPWPVLNALGACTMTQPCFRQECSLQAYNYVPKDNVFVCAAHFTVCCRCKRKTVNSQHYDGRDWCKDCRLQCTRCGHGLLIGHDPIHRRSRRGAPHCLRCFKWLEFSEKR